MISFEFPIVERVRVLLRLDEQFRRLAFFTQQADPWAHQAALLILFELADFAMRVDPKSDLLQELERQKQLLESLRDNPSIVEQALDEVLAEIEQALCGLLETPGKLGQHLRESDWLSSLRQRAATPGGICQFELPSYRFWLNQSAVLRQADLDQWSAPMQATYTAARLLLRLLRDSGKTMNYHAARGIFQQMSGGRVLHMARVVLDESLAVVPELSANKYALNVRFVTASSVHERPRQSEADIPFSLVYCKL